MTQYRSQQNISIGSEPPQSVWTMVRGDTASFKMYVQDDAGNPLVISEWTIKMDFYRPSTDSLIFSTTPEPTETDGPGEFTVYLNSSQTDLLETDDEFDIQLSYTDDVIVWTVLQGKAKIIEDITE